MNDFLQATTLLVLKRSNEEPTLKLCYCYRGWRIQWSIVPQVSEPVVNMNLDFLLLLIISRNIIKNYFLQELFFTLTNENPKKERLSIWHHFFSSQEPPKEDLTVSEKFQLVLDVAQKAQV